MGNQSEYIFCPYCGGITIPGICVNCGMRTSKEEQSESVGQDESLTQSTDSAPQTGQNVAGQAKGQSNNYEKYQPGYNVSQPNGQYQNPQMQVQGGYQAQYQGTSSQGYVGYQGNNAKPSPAYTPMQSTQINQGQQPNMSYSYDPPKKKSHWWIWLLVIGLLLFLGIFILIFVIIGFVAFSKIQEPASVTVQPSYGTTSEYNVGSSDSSTVAILGRELDRLDLSGFDWEAYADASMVYSDTSDGSKDLFLNKDYVSTFGTNHDNHSSSEFSGEFFEAFCDCIDTSYDYRLERHFVDYSNVHDDIIVNGKIAYIQFAGDIIPNEDKINQQIMELTMNDFWGYLDGQKAYYSSYSEITFMVDSFIPYNDGEKMSILLDVNIYDGDYRDEHYIYAINIDLVNGEIMDNDSIIEVNGELVDLFRERNDAQNGTDVYGVVNATDAQIAEFLSSPDTNIVFFTPYGMEIGYNYESVEASWGWVTITLPEYEDYIK